MSSARLRAACSSLSSVWSLSLTPSAPSTKQTRKRQTIGRGVGGGGKVFQECLHPQLVLHLLEDQPKGPEEQELMIWLLHTQPEPSPACEVWKLGGTEAYPRRRASSRARTRENGSTVRNADEIEFLEDFWSLNHKQFTFFAYFTNLRLIFLLFFYFTLNYP